MRLVDIDWYVYDMYLRAAPNGNGWRTRPGGMVSAPRTVWQAWYVLYFISIIYVFNAIAHRPRDHPQL